MDRIDSPITEKVCIDMPANLARILRADAVLHDMAFEESVIATLHEIVLSWLDGAWASDVFDEAYRGTYTDNADKQEVVVQ